VESNFWVMSEYLANKKYQALLRTGKDLFWKYGLKRVSIEEICKEASVSKMTFYKFFPNKIELARTILNNIMKESTRQFSDLIASSGTFEEKVHQMMLMKLHGTKDLSAEFLNDIYMDKANGLQKDMTQHSAKSMQIFIEFLEDAKNEGFIRKEIKIEFVIYQLELLTKTAVDEKLLSLYDSPGELIMEGINFLFYGLMPKKELK